MNLSSKRTLYFDIESRNSGEQFDYLPEEFVRLFQYAWDDGPVQLTTDYQEMLSLVREADWVCGHNISVFDLPVLFGVDSMEPLHMAMEKKVIDTFVIASLITPAPNKFTTTAGHTFYNADKPGTALKWLGLENLSHQFWLEGKFGNLAELAAKYNPPKTKRKDLDFSLIPLDDEEFLEYARQDVVAGRDLWKYLRNLIQEQDYNRDLIWYELEVAAIMARMSNNGLKINTEFAYERIAGMAEKREEIMSWLIEEYDFPQEGKSPWASAKGKEVILKVLADHGITEKSRPDWTKTATGNISLGGEVLVELTQGTELEEFGKAIAALKGQRTLPQLALDSMYSDGKVHMDITSLQRSRRWSFSNPGITIWGSKGDLAIDKKVFTAEEGKVLVGMDFSNADARAMAALSGDHEFARRFTEEDEDGNPLHDGHNLVGIAAFGEDTYFTGWDGPRDASARPKLREAAKIISHGTNYNMGAYKLAVTLNEVSEKQGLGVHFWAPANTKYGQKPIEEFEDSINVPDLLDGFNRTYAFLKKFKDMAAEDGKKGWVENSWGCRLMVDPDRSWTQAPSLHGQSTTRFIASDGLRKLVRKGGYYARSLRAVIHDEVLLEFDEETVDKDVQVALECLQTTFNPPGPIAIPIEFPVSYGIGRTWFDAGH